MKNLEEILDDSTLKGRLVLPINKELRKLSYWLRFSGGILAIVAISGLLLLLNIVSTTDYYPVKALVVLSGVFCVCIGGLFLVAANFKYAESAQNFVLTERGGQLEQLVANSRSSWRLVFITLTFFSLLIGYIFGNIFYDIYHWNYYEKLPEMEERLQVPDEEFLIAPLDEEDLEELEEDPAPPSD